MPSGSSKRYKYLLKVPHKYPIYFFIVNIVDKVNKEMVTIHVLNVDNREYDFIKKVLSLLWMLLYIYSEQPNNITLNVEWVDASYGLNLSFLCESQNRHSARTKKGLNISKCECNCWLKCQISTCTYTELSPPNTYVFNVSGNRSHFVALK